MKWHRVLIYFGIWASAFISLYQGGELMTGMNYGSSETAERVYARVPAAKPVDIIFGLGMIVLGGFLIYVRFQMAGLKKGAPKKLILAYALILLVTAGYLLAISAVTGVPLGDLISSNLLVSFAQGIILILVSRAYYQKRAHLFGEAAPASSGTVGAGAAGTLFSQAPQPAVRDSYCTRCGAKVGPDELYCTKCGAKLG